jgi:hypothetical protein
VIRTKHANTFHSKDRKIEELEAEIERLEQFTGFIKTGYPDYPYKRENGAGYYELYRSKTEDELRRLGETWHSSLRYGTVSFLTIPEHRYVMAKHLGFEIPKGYAVHHKDRNKLNNAISNLELLTKNEHSSLHGKLSRIKAITKRKNLELNNE